MSGLAVIAVGYAYLATAPRPFTDPAYLAVAVPVVLLGIPAVLRRGPRRPRVHVARAWPWFALVALAVALESVGLALGGRSPSVPTLSTVVDHALAGHIVRAVLFCGWLALPAFALLRTRAPGASR
jgi:hypothetical protein